MTEPAGMRSHPGAAIDARGEPTFTGRPFIGLAPIVALGCVLALRIDVVVAMWIPIVAGSALGLVFSRALRDDLRAGVARLVADVRFATGDAGGARYRAVRGRVEVITPVREPVLGADVGAYFVIDRSPRRSVWDLFWFLGLARLLRPHALPMDAYRTGLGEVEIVLDDGRRARIEGDDVLVVDRRRVRLRAKRRVVIEHGDRVEVRGVSDVESASGALVFRTSQTQLALVARG